MSLLGLSIALVALVAACQGAPFGENANSSLACTHLYPAGVHKIELDGRFFLLLVPSSLSRDKPAPIVVDVPG